MDHQQFIVYIGEVVTKNWRRLLIEVTISKRLFVVMQENGTFWEFCFPNGTRWEFSQCFTVIPRYDQARFWAFAGLIRMQERSQNPEKEYIPLCIILRYMIIGK